ncbi:hypothetical protein BBJ28_00014518 [Nothophytophthora sp. Chile5]|nr:hypothetical protein BBJ28_00014518 [Nothophytophthora sp. Chile5]
MECELCQPLATGLRPVVAVKCISLPRAVDARALVGATRALDDPMQERRVSALLSRHGGHRNVVRSYSHFVQHRCLYLVAEYCADGDLYSHLAATTAGTGLDERRAANVMKQVFAGVNFLHSELGVAHRDLSLENVLLLNGVCKISDFGLSTDASSVCVGRVGKEYYMAPEVVAGKEYDPVKADIWSMGIMWFIMLTGSPLVSIASQKERAFVVLEGCGVGAVLESWGYAAKLSASTIDLVSRMLKVDPNERVSLSEILQHPCAATE